VGVVDREDEVLVNGNFLHFRFTGGSKYSSSLSSSSLLMLLSFSCTSLDSTLRLRDSGDEGLLLIGVGSARCISSGSVGRTGKDGEDVLGE
jgi:hypothetical protein